MTGIVARQSTDPYRLSEIGVKSARLMGGMALTTEHNDPIARERSARDANPDNPNILTCLRDAGVSVSSYKDFRQLETVVRVPRTQPEYRALIGFASTNIQKIGSQHRVDTTRGMGGATGFHISLITDAGGEHVLGFLGHNETGGRIFLSKDGDLARVWHGQ